MYYIVCVTNFANVNQDIVINVFANTVAVTNCNLTRTNDNTLSNSFLISPNPATDKVKIELSHTENALTINSIQVYNQLGQHIKTQDLQFINNTASITTSGLPAGLYTLLLNTNQGNTLKKRLVIEH